MKPDSALRVQTVCDNGKPQRVARLRLDVVLYCGESVRYTFSATTNWLGRCNISYSLLERQRRKNQRLSLMDYNTPLDQCEDFITLHVPTPAELNSRLASSRHYYSWLNHMLFAFRYRTAGNRHYDSEDTRVNLHKGVADVELRCAPITS